MKDETGGRRIVDWMLDEWLEGRELTFSREILINSEKYELRCTYSKIKVREFQYKHCIGCSRKNTSIKIEEPRAKR